MNLIWFLLTAFSLAALLLKDPSAALPALLSGSAQAVELTVKLTATYAFWCGFFRLAEDLGFNERLAKWLDKPIRFLFPKAGKRAKEQICLNVSANLLGLGNAATPAGIEAVTELSKEEKGSEYAALFFVIAATGLQVLPTTVMGLRVSAGSENPSAVLLPCFLASLTAAVVGVVLCKLVAAWSRCKKHPVSASLSTEKQSGTPVKKQEKKGLSPPERKPNRNGTTDNQGGCR